MYRNQHQICHEDEAIQQQQQQPCNRPRFKLFLSEFIGTYLFVFLAQAALTSFELTGNQNDIIIRQLSIILTQGLAFLAACLITLNSSGAHLNPAYTLSSAVFGYIKWSKATTFLLAQYAGSFLAAIILHATYCDKLAQRHIEGLLSGPNSTFRAHGHILSTGKLFSSYPPTEVSLMQLTISYMLASMHLMFILLTIQDSRLVKLSRSSKPFYMATAVMLIEAAFAANGGPVLNPAQDLSPRLYIALFGWGSSAFNLHHSTYWWAAGVMAPHIGALFGFGLYQIMTHVGTIHRASSRLKQDRLTDRSQYESKLCET